MKKTFVPNDNFALLSGHITADAKLFKTDKATLARFTVAVNKRYKKEDGSYGEKTNFIPVVIWNSLAEKLVERLKVGTGVSVQGEMTSHNWETKEGQKRTSNELAASRVKVLTYDNEAATAEEATTEHPAPENIPHPAEV